MVLLESEVQHQRALIAYLSLSTAGTLLICCSSTSLRTSASNSASCSLCSRRRSRSICRQNCKLSIALKFHHESALGRPLYTRDFHDCQEQLAGDGEGLRQLLPGKAWQLGPDRPVAGNLSIESVSRLSG